MGLNHRPSDQWFIKCFTCKWYLLLRNCGWIHEAAKNNPNAKMIVLVDDVIVSVGKRRRLCKQDPLSNCSTLSMLHEIAPEFY